MMALHLTTAPAIEPVTVEEVRYFLRIDSDPGEDDALIGSLITAARQEAEKITRRQLITATWEMRLDEFPCGDWGIFSGPPYDYGRPSRNELIPGRGESQTIYLPMPPLQSIAAVFPETLGGISYLDSGGTEQDLVEDIDYLVDTYSEPARITPAFGMVWPTTYPVPGAVRIVFKAGYGDDATSVPMAIKNWIKAMVGSMWENRETMVISPTTLTMVNLGFLDGLLDNYRVFGLE